MIGLCKPVPHKATISQARDMQLLLGHAPNYKTDFEDDLWKASLFLGGRKGMEKGSVRGRGEVGEECVIDIQNKIVSNLN